MNLKGPGLGRVVLGVVAISVALLMFPLILDGAEEIATDATTDIEQKTTGVGETSATVTLTSDPWNNAVANITSVTSSTTTDTSPTASTYNASTNVLTVTGLAASTTRTLTVGYNYNAVSSYTGMENVVEIAPLVVFSGMFLGGAVSIIFGVKARQKATAKTKRY